MEKRYPVAAGTFYPSDKDSLLKEIERCFLHPLGPGKKPGNPSESGVVRCIAYISPHAGYVYSGPIAAHVYYSLSCQKRPRAIVVVGPNHSGLGSPAAIMVRGVWVTPLGEVSVDTELAMAVARRSSYLDVDDKPFIYEHSIEVQLPFIQFIYRSNPPPIVPIAIALEGVEVVEDVCEALCQALPNDVVLIATTDWTHYEPYETARSKDLEALRIVETLDYLELLRYAERVNLTACGLPAVAVSMCFAKKRGVRRAKVLAYATSGDVTKRRDSVVGYAAVEFPLGD